MSFKIELTKLNKKLEIYKAKKMNTDELVKQRSETKQKIDEFFQNISKLNNVVFISFENCEKRENYFNKFPSSFVMKFIRFIQNILVNSLCSCCFEKSYKRKIKLLTTLKVEEAPEPSDIIWQNLEFSDLNKILRKIGIYFITILLISISFGIVILLNYIQNKYKDDLESNINLALSLIISLIITVINTLLNTTIRKLSE
jgi:hypothetical protein